MFQVYSKVIKLYVYTLVKVLFHYRLLQNTEYSSLCYSTLYYTVVGPCCLFYMSVNSKFLIYPPPSLLITVTLLSCL